MVGKKLGEFLALPGKELLMSGVETAVYLDDILKI